jgi:hypothetical protein
MSHEAVSDAGVGAVAGVEEGVLGPGVGGQRGVAAAVALLDPIQLRTLQGVGMIMNALRTPCRATTRRPRTRASSG